MTIDALPSWNALLISVGAYRHHASLRASAVDARQLEAVLADPDLCGFAKIDRLEDPAAEQARQAVTGFLERHGDGPMLIYFTGHGKYDFAAGRLHLLTVDSPFSLDDHEGLSVTDDWLIRELARARSDSAFVVLDTCFTGAALTMQAIGEIPYARAFQPIVGGHGFHTLAAACPLEPAGGPAADGSAIGGGAAAGGGGSAGGSAIGGDSARGGGAAIGGGAAAGSGAAAGRPTRLTHALIEVLRDGSATDDTGCASVGRLCEVVAKRSTTTLLSSAHPRGRELYVARRPPEQTNLAAVRRALSNRDYATVRRLLRPVKDSDNGDYRYYLVLGLFGGHRPQEFATDDIRRAEGHLAGASTRPPHLCALWALIREDHYGMRGMDPGPPTVEELIQHAREIGPGHAAEIVTHLPAPECQTWLRLRNRAQSQTQSSGV